MKKGSLFPLVLVSFSQFLAMLIWFNYSAILPLVKADWNLTDGQAGMILSAFQFGYVVSVLILGYLSDRVNPRIIFIISALIAGISGVLFGLYANGFWSGLIFRTIAGIGIGGIYVPGMKYLSSIYPPHTRGKVFGIYVGALVVGSGSSLLFSSPLIAFFGWQEVVIITSLGSFVAALVMAMYRYDPPLPERPVSISWSLVKKLMTNKKLVNMNIAYTGHMWELYAFWGWIGPFMIFTAVKHGYSIQGAQQLGNLLAGLFIIVGAVGTWIGGELSDHLGRVKILKPLLFIGFLCSLTFGWLANLPLFIIIFIGLIYGLVVAGDSPIYSVAISELSDRSTVGFALGIQQVLGYSITIISPTIFGVILGLFSNETIAWGSAFTLLALGSFTSLWILQRGKASLNKLEESNI